MTDPLELGLALFITYGLVLYFAMILADWKYGSDDDRQ